MAFTYIGSIEIELPDDCVDDCSHQGRCDEDVEHWQKTLNLNIDRKQMVEELMEYGAWMRKDLNALDDDELEMKIIWIAACNIKEENMANESHK